MEHLDHPSKKIWNERRIWFESLNEKVSGEGSYLVSEQACALICEVECAFCAGAWISVIILAMIVVDAQLRETELLGFKGSTKQLIKSVSANPELQKLRKRRNALVHLNSEKPAITVDQQWLERNQLENEARKAIELMFEAFYLSPGV